jgi:hypothetical protein
MGRMKKGIKNDERETKKKTMVKVETRMEEKKESK